MGFPRRRHKFPLVIWFGGWTLPPLPDDIPDNRSQFIKKFAVYVVHKGVQLEVKFTFVEIGRADQLLR